MTDDSLENLLAEVKPPDEPDKWPSGAARGIARVRYTHDAMIDIIIADPCITQNELAARFGYTPGWVSQIITSDAFQARLAERSKDLIDPTIRATVEERFKAIVLRSLEILREKLDRPAAQVPDNLALRTLEISSRAAGFGAKTNGPGQSAVDVHVHIENLGNNLTQLLRRRRQEVIEGDFSDEG